MSQYGSSEVRVWLGVLSVISPRETRAIGCHVDGLPLVSANSVLLWLLALASVFMSTGHLAGAVRHI